MTDLVWLGEGWCAPAWSRIYDPVPGWSWDQIEPYSERMYSPEELWSSDGIPERPVETIYDPVCEEPWPMPTARRGGIRYGE